MARIIEHKIVCLYTERGRERGIAVTFRWLLLFLRTEGRLSSIQPLCSKYLQSGRSQFLSKESFEIQSLDLKIAISNTAEPNVSCQSLLNRSNFNVWISPPILNRKRPTEPLGFRRIWTEASTSFCAIEQRAQDGFVWIKLWLPHTVNDAFYAKLPSVSFSLAQLLFLLNFSQDFKSAPSETLKTAESFDHSGDC